MFSLSISASEARIVIKTLETPSVWILPISAIQISFLSFLKSSTTFKVSITLRDSLSNLETTSLDPDLSSDKTFWKIGLFLNSTPPETTSV